MDGCAKDLSNFIFEMGVSCSPPLPRAAGENTRKTGFLHKKAYKSKKKKKFAIFLDIPKEEPFMYII